MCRRHRDGESLCRGTNQLGTLILDSRAWLTIVMINFILDMPKQMICFEIA